MSRSGTRSISRDRRDRPGRQACKLRSERRPPVTLSIRAARFVPRLLLSTVLLTALACTDLTESPSSTVVPANFYRNEAEVLAGVASVYATLRGTLDDYWYATEVSSDEIVVPTRGSDWFDNGQWLE